MKNCFSYGDNNIFWQNQHIFFSEDLQSFDIDSNIKGRYKNGESYRGLCSICLEVFEEIAEQNSGYLSIEGICNAQNGVFATEYVPDWYYEKEGDIDRVLYAAPEMKTITLDQNSKAVILD